MTVEEFFDYDRFAKEAGVELLEVGNGTARARMEILPKHLNGGNVCQGGAIFTLADLAFAAAINSHGELTFGVSASIQFFKSESKGFLYADANEIFNHGRLCHCEVRVTNEVGDLVAMFSSMGYHKRQELPFEAIE